VAAARAPAFELAARSDFDSFAQTLMAFLFRHLLYSFKYSIWKYKTGKIRDFEFLVKTQTPNSAKIMAAANIIIKS